MKKQKRKAASAPPKSQPPIPPEWQSFWETPYSLDGRLNSLTRSGWEVFTICTENRIEPSGAFVAGYRVIARRGWR